MARRFSLVKHDSWADRIRSSSNHCNIAVDLMFIPSDIYAGNYGLFLAILKSVIKVYPYQYLDQRKTVITAQEQEQD